MTNGAPAVEKSTKWIDIAVIFASLFIIGLSVVWLSSNGTFKIDLSADAKLSWHLVRSSGIVAYVLLLTSTVWGLFMSSQFVKNWSPGPISMTMHSTISWLALILGLGHGLLLLFDDYFKYTLSDILIPFVGPYRPEVVGLGTLAFWIIVLVTLSFAIKKRIGPKVWKNIHYASYAGFGLVSAHGLLAGTDSSALGFQLLMGGGMFVVVLLLGIRMGQDRAKANAPAPARRARS